MRVTNRVLAIATALALVVGGALIAAEIGLAAVGAQPWVLPWDDWYRQARTHTWDSAAARSLFLALTLVGVVVVALQVVRGRPRSLELAARNGRAGVNRRSVERAVAGHTAGEDGISSAHATIRRRRLMVRATTGRTEGDLRPRVEEAAHRKLRALGLDEQLRVSVRIDRRDS